MNMVLHNTMQPDDSLPFMSNFPQNSY